MSPQDFTPLRVAVFGTGGVGGYFGARLAEAGHAVTFIARGAHLQAIRERGLRVESIRGDVHIFPAQATDDPAEVGPVDLVLVATKAWQLPEAAAAMRPLVGPETVVLPLLNGVEAPEVLAAALGPEPVLGGLCKVSAYKAAPGLIRHVGIEPEVVFGELDGRRTPRIARLEQAFAACRGVKATVPPDIRAAMWAKLTFIAAFSAVGAVTRAPAGVIRRLPETRRLLEAAMREIVAVAQGIGVALSDEAVDQALAFTDRMEPQVTASMQRDIMEGRPSELEAQVGVVVRFGRQAGVPTPVNAFLYAALLPQERRARGLEAW